MKFKVHVNSLITNDRGQFALVKEGKALIYGKYNLPGGHLEYHETIPAGALREIAEETGLDAKLEGLLGVWTNRSEEHYAVGFVFLARANSERFTASCPDILECQWFTAAALSALPDDLLVNPVKIRGAIQQYQAGKIAPFDSMERLIDFF